jgi:hypothetical protein
VTRADDAVPDDAPHPRRHPRWWNFGHAGSFEITPPTHLQVRGTNTRGCGFTLELHENGLLVVHGEFGVWRYRWWSRGGPRSLAAFCLNIDQGYAYGKLCNLPRQDDYDATAAGVKALIIELRKDGEMSKADAREEWDKLESCDSSEEWMQTTDFDAPWEHTCTMPDPTFRDFWETTWVPCIQPALEALVALESK